MLEPHIEEIDRLFNGDTVEEIVHNLKMEGSEWAKKQLDTLSKMVRRKRSAVHYKLSRFLCIWFILNMQILYTGFFRPVLFFPFFTWKRFCLVWICSDKVVLYKREIMWAWISPSLKFTCWQRGRKMRNKTGYTCIQYETKCTTNILWDLYRYISADTCIILIKGCVWLILWRLLHNSYVCLDF